MRNFLLVVALCALGALVFADEVPSVFMACSFRAVAHMNIVTVDGEVLAKTMDEIIHDNKDYWVWKSQMAGNEFIQSFLPDHEWSITWRPDMNVSYRQDFMTHKCSVSAEIPTPYEWVESRTYGIGWFDEPVKWEGKDGTLYTAVASGHRAGFDFELLAGFYVVDGSVVYINGTVTGAHKEIEIAFYTTAISFEHNKAIDPRVFAVNAPCDKIDPPPEPSDDFKLLCYRSAASIASFSWLALLVALFAALLRF